MAIKTGQRFTCNTDTISGLPEGTIVEVGAVAEDGTIIVITHNPTQTVSDDMILSMRYQPVAMGVPADVFASDFSSTKKQMGTEVGAVVPDA